MDGPQPSFRVTYISPSGFKYEVTGHARNEVEAVGLANEALEHQEGIGISDHLRDDLISVRPPAQLHVERIGPDEATPGLGLAITAPDGRVTRK